jgi:hypothetical protein
MEATTSIQLKGNMVVVPTDLAIVVMTRAQFLNRRAVLQAQVPARGCYHLRGWPRPWSRLTVHSRP